MRLTHVLGTTLLLAAVACGGGQKPSSGLQKGNADVPPPPDVSTVKPEHNDAPRDDGFAVSARERKLVGAGSKLGRARRRAQRLERVLLRDA